MIKKELGKKILIVDNDTETRNILGSILTRKKFIVEKAGNGKEALEKIKKNKPDLILLDYIMPVMDGFETWGHLKSNPQTQNIPIILCTTTHIEKGKDGRIKVNDYLEKPFTIEEVCKKINKILKNN